MSLPDGGDTMKLKVSACLSPEHLFQKWCAFDFSRNDLRGSVPRALGPSSAGSADTRIENAQCTNIHWTRGSAQERKFRPKRKFWAGYPCGLPARNFGQALQILEKNKHFHTDIPCGRPWKTSVWKTSGWFFVPYLQSGFGVIFLFWSGVF